MFTLNSIERVEIEEAFMKIFWLDKAVVELKYVISEEKDINMAKILEMAQARLHREQNDGWLNLCRVVKKYTEPPYQEQGIPVTIGRGDGIVEHGTYNPPRCNYTVDGCEGHTCGQVLVCPTHGT